MLSRDSPIENSTAWYQYDLRTIDQEIHARNFLARAKVKQGRSFFKNGYCFLSLNRYSHITLPQNVSLKISNNHFLSAPRSTP